MDKTVKYLGGIGYLLLVVAPLLSIGLRLLDFLGALGVILVAVAWILLGRVLDDRVMLANGIMMIVTPIVSLILLFGVIATMLPKTNLQPPTLPPNPMGFLKVLMVVVAIIIVIGFVEWILHLLSLLRAGNKLKINLFKYSAYCQIASFVVFILGFALMVNSVLSIAPLIQTQMMKPNPMLLYKIFGTAFIVLAIGGILGIISNVLAAVGFFSLEEAA